MRFTKIPDFYPRSPRGDRPAERQKAIAENHISIHAPREGSDFDLWQIARLIGAFLSTLPARGATVKSHRATAMQHISIHAPREGSDPTYADMASAIKISIHAPREGSDPSACGTALRPLPLLSTLPARGATYGFWVGIAMRK